MSGPTEPLDLILSDFEGQIQGHTDFESLNLVKELSYTIYNIKDRKIGNHIWGVQWCHQI